MQGRFADRPRTSQGPRTLRSDSGPCEDPPGPGAPAGFEPAPPHFEFGQPRDRALARPHARTRFDAERAADALAARHAEREAPQPEVTANSGSSPTRRPRASTTRTARSPTRPTSPTFRSSTSTGRTTTTRRPGLTTSARWWPRSRARRRGRRPGASTTESADSVRDAQRALAEITARVAADAECEAEDSCAGELARWHAEDETTASLNIKGRCIKGRCAIAATPSQPTHAVPHSQSGAKANN